MLILVFFIQRTIYSGVRRSIFPSGQRHKAHCFGSVAPILVSLTTSVVSTNKTSHCFNICRSSSGWLSRAQHIDSLPCFRVCCFYKENVRRTLICLDAYTRVRGQDQLNWKALRGGRI